MLRVSVQQRKAHAVAALPPLSIIDATRCCRRFRFRFITPLRATAAAAYIEGMAWYNICA